MPYLDNLLFPIYHRYPGMTTEVDVGHISTWTDMDWLRDVLQQLCPPHAYTPRPDLSGPHARVARLQFHDVADADRTMAIMNTHPVLRGHDLTFCRPGDVFYPELRALFTAREVEPAAYGGPLVSTGEDWMRERGWDEGTPSPDQVYDVAIKCGPVHHITVRSRPTVDSPWQALVQFFDTDAANKFDELDNDLVFGWRV